ncbi:MAG: Gfo/Idh/MocA family oxidoreductase [Planctomycetes bacterium]|nr:Gfo/Idh/MocA family oxidoreductase [Planctomycetota bacterium]
MKILVVGCGSIGERHIRNLKALGVDEIIACDTDKARLNSIKQKYQVTVIPSLKDALKQPLNAMLICTPPHLHLPIAFEGIKKGQSLFIEKPISHNLLKVNQLCHSVKSKKLVFMVGFNFRFNAGLIKIKQLIERNQIGKVISGNVSFGSYLPARHPNRDYRQEYGAKAEWGGGVILDAIIHQIDYLVFLLGKVASLFCLADKRSKLELNVEDCADILLQFKSHAVITLHSDFIRRPYSHSFELVGDSGTIIWDIFGCRVKWYNAHQQKWHLFDYNKDLNKMYLAELKHFINCVRQKKVPDVTCEDGRYSLMIALAAKESALAGKMLKI